MSSVGYQGLLYRVSQRLKDVTKINQLLHTSSNARLISENSESFNIQVNEGDNTAITLKKLFSDLDESDNLGLDNLGTLRDLLTEVKEWSLVDEVDKFERQRKDFNALLEKIIPKLEELDNLEQLLSICKDYISDDAKEEIKDVRALLKELQKKNRLGSTRLEVLRKISNETGQQELLDLLTEFEKKWKAEEKAERRRDRVNDVVNTVIGRRFQTIACEPAHHSDWARMHHGGTLPAPTTAVYSTVKNTWEQFIGAIKIHCNFSTVSRMALTVGMGIILQKGAQATLGEFVKIFTQVLLPAGTSLRTMGEGSLCFTVQAENNQALEALWQRYQDGTLQRNLQEFLVTDDIRQLAGGEEVILSAYIDEQDYNNARLSISIAEQQVLQKENQEISPKRARRNSDSSLHAIRSNEKLVVITLREQIKLYQERIKALEEEIEKMRAQEMSDSENVSELPVVAGSSSISNNNTNRKPPEIDYTNPPAGKELKKKDFPAFKDWRPWDRVKLPVDILLLTVVDCEFLACAHYLKPEFYTSYHEKLGPVCFGEIGEEGQDSLKIALYQSPDKGPTEATIVVKNTVEVLKPKAAIWVGFCGGLKEDKLKSGDVVISSKLRTYSAEEVTEEITVDRNIAAPSFKNFLNLLKFADHGWNPPLKDEAGLKVKVVKNGVLLSPPKVVDNKKLRAELTYRFPDVDAIEMEGEGLYAAAHELKMEWVVIKGVSDFADGTKSSSDHWRSFASFMAASVTAHILNNPNTFKNWPHYRGASSAEDAKRKETEAGDQSAKRLKLKLET